MQLSAFLNLEFFQHKVYSMQLLVRISAIRTTTLAASHKICVDKLIILLDFDVTMVRISKGPEVPAQGV